ncbi:MAG TPA: peptidoglycan-binding protein LysM [Saprospiraceae bacterium]|nr:peptidoglycan-binding protein LysM [Saprospiraceae bacterium]
MGLFSFFKKAGARKIEPTASKGISAEELKKAKISLLHTIVKDTGITVEELDIEFDDDQVTVYGEVQTQEDREKIILSLGNVEGIACVDDRLSVVRQEPESIFYEVKKGDSLSKIAKAHYGNAMKYMEIFEANKPMLKDPNLIYPGQMLRIPPLV